MALDEASLIPCPNDVPATRIAAMASAIAALDGLGAPKVLRSVSGAPDVDIGDGRGLRSWCFDRRTPTDAGRLVANRLSKAPFLDGADGLFASVEGQRAIEPTCDGAISLGGGYAALSDGVLLLLHRSTFPANMQVMVALNVITDDDSYASSVAVPAVHDDLSVRAAADELVFRIKQAVKDGPALIARLPQLCPRVCLGTRAEKQLRRLSGSEPFFPQVKRHLIALNDAAERWASGSPFSPSVTYSPESDATLNDRSCGPLRDFPTPAGFASERWTLHTKMTGGKGARLYFKYCETADPNQPGHTIMRVAVGYVGPHLKTVTG